MSAAQQVTDAATELGVLLAIIELFTGALSAFLQSESARQGGAHKGARRQIIGLSIALALVSIASILSLLSLVRLVIDSHGTRSWEPAFWVFLLVYLLLIPLCIWQIIIAFGACRLKTQS